MWPDDKGDWGERFDKLFDPAHRPIPFRGDVREWGRIVNARIDVNDALRGFEDYDGGVTVTITRRDGGPAYSFDAEYIRFGITRPVERTGDGSLIGAEQQVTRLIAYTHGMPTRTE